ncbi:MAG: 23S rRNA (adenine(2503)-C(2))-methyltransferase RlmN [Clostridia bacterium]|nr:23S rRNA (adenine(2503)-C(2))-methyltransferase RlmN [Clostridia bacterium]
MITSVDIKSMSVSECRAFFASLGEPAFRADQTLEWLYRARLSSYASMTNLPIRLRQLLAEATPIRPSEAIAKVRSTDGTRKYLVGLADGNAVETVLMPHDYGLSLCVSSQVGCAMGCSFCASGIGGLVRSLECSEMIDQILAVSNDVGNERVSSVVMMGSGEPLANYENVLKFIKLINWDRGFGIGYRHITVSTCGILPGIRKLSGEGLPITLSVSLHAPDDDTRTAIMKINRTYPVKELVNACSEYAEITGRRVTYEYSLISGVNDSSDHAAMLAALIRGTLCHVNLIRLNPVAETGLERSSADAAERFGKILRTSGIETTIRREMGADIDAACGQLRRRWLREGGSLGSDCDHTV